MDSESGERRRRTAQLVLDLLDGEISVDEYWDRLDAETGSGGMRNSTSSSISLSINRRALAFSESENASTRSTWRKYVHGRSASRAAQGETNSLAA